MSTTIDPFKVHEVLEGANLCCTLLDAVGQNDVLPLLPDLKAAYDRAEAALSAFYQAAGLESLDPHTIAAFKSRQP